MLKIVKKSKVSNARVTELKTAHGKIMGPFFMPIATKAAVKNLSTDEIKKVGAQIILSNTYHLMITPTNKLIKKAGGLHKFMNWPGPILTDSGGFQVYSLSNLRKITELGVIFSDPMSGKKYSLTPELSMDIQSDLGVDIAMAFDEVIGYPASKELVKQAMERTTRWAQRCLKHREKQKQKNILFGIVQGGIYQDLRLKSVKALTDLPFDGYAIGGIAVGEPRNMMAKILDWVIPELPEHQPRYLMGLGRPDEIVAAVRLGIDMFDCVIPTREARHGRLYLWHSKNLKSKTFYKTINITNAKYAKDFSPINSTNLKQYSKAYLHHLFNTKEPLGMRLATLNNLDFYLTLMSEIRQTIRIGKL
ncbi:MAG: tRNA guanosine(34) transglycosylase Tgt [Patescibacteria group bacterium]|nr:tRNA guanosine(34) transglycosylase Tgt [Patescibacteria group bacterium]